MFIWSQWLWLSHRCQVRNMEKLWLTISKLKEKKAENILHLNRKNKHWRKIQFIKMYQCSSNCFDRTSSTSTEQWPFTPALLWVVQHWPTPGTQTPLRLGPLLERTQGLCVHIRPSQSVPDTLGTSSLSITCFPLLAAWKLRLFSPSALRFSSTKTCHTVSSTASYFPRRVFKQKWINQQMSFRKYFIGYQNKMWLTTLELHTMIVSKETTVSLVPKVCGNLAKLYTYKFSI